MARALLTSYSIAFACRFLPDEELNQLLNDFSLVTYFGAVPDPKDCTSTGNLEGLVLVGWVGQVWRQLDFPSDVQGVGLVSAYVDMTADVQTASLLACTLARRIIIAIAL